MDSSVHPRSLIADADDRQGTTLSPVWLLDDPPTERQGDNCTGDTSSVVSTRFQTTTTLLVNAAIRLITRAMRRRSMRSTCCQRGSRTSQFGWRDLAATGRLGVGTSGVRTEGCPS